MVKKKWNFCPAPNNSHTTIKADSASSGSSSKSFVESIKDQKVSSSSHEEKSSKSDLLCSELTQRLESLEKKLSCFTARMDEQNEKNCVAYEEFQKFKHDFENSVSLSETIESSSSSKIQDSETDSRNQKCKIKLNIRQEIPKVSEEGESEDDDEEEEEDLPLMSNEVQAEIDWLKARMVDVSEQLKLHSECLKTLKCEDFEKLRRKFDCLQDSVMKLKCQVLTNQTSMVSQVSNGCESDEEISRFRKEILKINYHLDETDKKVEKAKEDACEGLYSLKQDLMSRINNQFKPETATTNHSSHFICAENLDNSEESEERLKTSCEEAEISDDQKNEVCCGDKSPMFNWYQPPSPKIISVTSSCRQFDYPSNSNESLQDVPNCSEIPKFPDNPCTTFNYSPCCAENQQLLGSQQSYDGYYAKPNDCQMYANANENNQIQSPKQGFCLQQLMRDIASKLDRSEFECYRRQLLEMSDIVMSIRRRLECSTSAGGIVPASCIACSAQVNMMVDANSFPCMPALKFGRTSGVNCCDMPPECPSLLNRHYQRQMCNGIRRACGSHTKLAKAMEVHQMRFKRLRTPIKVITPMMMLKNYCRRVQHC